jgi:ribosomal protein L5
VNRLKEKFVKEVTPALMSKFNYKSVMEVPKLNKIVVNWALVTQSLMQNHSILLLKNLQRSQVKNLSLLVRKIYRWLPSS